MNQLVILALLGLIGVLVYLAVGDDLRRLLRRRTESYRVSYRQYLTRPVLIPAIVFAVLGVLMRDVILTPFLWALGGAVAYFRIRQTIAESETITPRHVAQLVMAFRGAYQLEPAAFASLEEAATKVGEPLRSLISTTVDIFFTTSDPERAFAAFRKSTHSALLHQFIYILEMSESASDESITDALDAFVGRLRQQEELQRQVETGLAGITGQTSFMQGLVVVIAFVIAIVPGFRGAYTGTVSSRFFYLFLIAVILAASYMIEKRVSGLKERIL